jgi:adenosyl cobinamide kinase/adenosyl cobinamide phosphate guanylyltransferase
MRPSTAFRSRWRSGICSFSETQQKEEDSVGEIRYLATRDLLKDDVLERIVAAAKANAGLWLMVKERAVEKRAIKAELERRGRTQKTYTGSSQ